MCAYRQLIERGKSKVMTILSRIALSASFLAVGLGAAPGHALSFYTDRSMFEAALGAVTVVDFNGFPGQPASFDGTSLDVGPFTLTGDSTGDRSNMQITGDQAFGNVCGTAACGAIFGYRIAFDAAIRGFGADYELAATSSGLTFTINGQTFNGLTTFPGTGFFGFIDTSPFSTITVSGEDEIHQFDNVTFDTAVAAAVPEPATWAMLILAAGMAGGALRRRRVAA